MIAIGNRKWREKLKNPKKGKFDIEEERALLKSFNMHILEHHISYEEAIQSLSEE